MRSGGRSSIPKQSSRSRSAGACQQKIHFLHASFRYARIEDDSKFLATHRQVVELLQKPKISDTPRIKKKKGVPLLIFSANPSSHSKCPANYFKRKRRKEEIVL